jgi:PPOX class probable FMN-dependent enzyme
MVPVPIETAFHEIMKNSETRIPASHRVTSIEQLESVYGEPAPRSLAKEIPYISDHYRAFIEKAPFVTVATAGPEGLDCSPRGDPAGFVRVVDEKTLMMPDRRGNNRIDSLRNLVRDPRISLLFLIPGINESLRINGRAEIVIDPDLCASFAIKEKLPRSVLVVSVERVYFQCQKALVRSRLWDAEAQIARSELPSTGKMLAALSESDFDAEEYDRTYPKHVEKTIY